MSKKEPKVAIVHDWLVGYAGGEIGRASCRERV